MKNNRLVKKIENLGKEINETRYSNNGRFISYSYEDYKREKISSLENEIKNLVKDAIEGTNEAKKNPYTQQERVDLFEKINNNYFNKYKIPYYCFPINDEDMWKLYSSLEKENLKNRVITNCGIDFSLFAKKIVADLIIESDNNSKKLINFIELCVNNWDKIKNKVKDWELYDLIKFDNLNDEKRRDYIKILSESTTKFPLVQYWLAQEITDLSLFIEAISMISYKEIWKKQNILNNLPKFLIKETHPDYSYCNCSVSSLASHIVELENPNIKHDSWKIPPSENTINYIELIKKVDVGDDPNLISIRNESQLQIAQNFLWEDFFKLLQYIEPSDEVYSYVKQKFEFVQLEYRLQSEILSKTEKMVSEATRYFKTDKQRFNIGKEFENRQNILNVISFMKDNEYKKKLILYPRTRRLFTEEEICTAACNTITDDQYLYEIAKNLSDLSLVKKMMPFFNDSYYLFHLIYDKFPNCRQQLEEILDSTAEESVRVQEERARVLKRNN